MAQPATTPAPLLHLLLLLLLLLHLAASASLKNTLVADKAHEPGVPEACQERVVRLEAEIRSLKEVMEEQQRYIQGLHAGQAQQLHLLPDAYLPADPLHLHRDCSEVFADGNVASGLYVVRPDGSPTALNVYCDMSNGGGWTVFQRRRNGKESFDRAWVEYKHGFGDLHSPDGEFWLGNGPLHHLTNQGNYDLRINMEDFEGNQRFAEYKKFRVDDEKDQFQLHVGEYSGTAGDALMAQRSGAGSSGGLKFSTFDHDDDDNATCIRHSKAGWWFSRCDAGNLNGHYYGGPYRAMADDGVVWYTWHGWWYSIKSVVMMVRAADLQHPPPPPLTDQQVPEQP